MGVLVFEWAMRLPLPKLADYLMDPSGKKEFQRYVRAYLSPNPFPTSAPTPTLQDYVDDYAEQVTGDAAADVEKYFRYYYIPGTVGGLSTGMSPLGVAATHVRCSYTALAALGEGLSGWFFEERGWTPISRPIMWPTDVVFSRSHEGQMESALVQVKSTQSATVRENMKGVMAEAAVKHAEHVRWVQQADPYTTWLCHVVGVVARQTGDFEISALSLSW